MTISIESCSPKTPFRLARIPSFLLVFRNGILLNQALEHDYSVSGNIVTYNFEMDPYDCFTFLYW